MNSTRCVSRNRRRKTRNCEKQYEGQFSIFTQSVSVLYRYYVNCSPCVLQTRLRIFCIHIRNTCRCRQRHLLCTASKSMKQQYRNVFCRKEVYAHSTYILCYVSHVILVLSERVSVRLCKYRQSLLLSPSFSWKKAGHALYIYCHSLHLHTLLLMILLISSKLYYSLLPYYLLHLFFFFSVGYWFLWGSIISYFIIMLFGFFPPRPKIIREKHARQ